MKKCTNIFFSLLFFLLLQYLFFLSFAFFTCYLFFPSLSLSFSVFWFFLFRKCTIQEKYDFLQWVCETRTPTQINSKVCFGCTFVRFRGLLTCSPRNIASNICICLFERQKDSLNTKLNGSNEKRIKKKHTQEKWTASVYVNIEIVLCFFSVGFYLNNKLILT